MDYFDRLSKDIKHKWNSYTSRFRTYIRRLLFPLYLFPVKIITYSLFYLVLFTIKLMLAFIGLIFDTIFFPFRSLKNFLKSIFILAVALYLCATFIVIADYINREYGYIGKFLCWYGIRENLQKSVVRVVGGYSEGTGFFIAPDRVLTNFHVISGEPYPKIILPDGRFTTPEKIIGDRDADLAVLITRGLYKDMVMKLPDKVLLEDDEPLFAAGYALGTDLTGNATVVKGNFIDFRQSRKDPVPYIQSNISLINGMSGGPLTDQCGKVIGINTMSLAGLSLFISGDYAKALLPRLTDQEITKIQVDPSKSPEDAVYAYYTYLKARRMKEGFNLLSKEYLKNTNFKEWTNRFTDILDVTVYKSERYKNTPDTVFVKFSTKNWVDNEAENHYYEGTWTMLEEDGVWKINDGFIKEVVNPDYLWKYL